MRAHRVAIELKTGESIPPESLVDHECHNTMCVNPAHLRLVNHKENAENRKGPARNSASGARGVYRNRDSNRWLAKVKHNGRSVHVGMFDTIEEASAAVAAKRNELFTHNNGDHTAATA